MILGITNYRNEDIENVNRQIKILTDKIGKIHIFIFHDNNYFMSRTRYDYDEEKLHIFTENKNMGTLYGRLEIIKNIPDEFDDEFLVWFDADDEFADIDFLVKIIEENKNIDWISDDIKWRALPSKIVKVHAYKKAIRKIKISPSLRVRSSECDIITAALYSLYIKGEISFKAIPNRLDWIKVNGNHQAFSINHDLCDDNYFDRLKGCIEDLVQWTIWKKIDRPNFDISHLNCDWFYNQNIEIIKEIKREINKINCIADDIIKNLPKEYKHIIEKEFKF